MAAKLGLRRLLVKRDDCTTLAWGGNKARKLEYLMAEALAKRADLPRTGGIDRDRTVVFIHTGGSPGLYAFEDQFRTLAKFETVRFNRRGEQ